MNNKLSIGMGAPGLWFADVIGSAWKLINTGMRFDENSPLHAEIVMLSEPHLAVLKHKREKHFESLELAGERRWQSELHHFVTQTILPQLDPAFDGYSVDDLIEMVDSVVASHKSEPTADLLPHTSRFDTSWAI